MKRLLFGISIVLNIAFFIILERNLAIYAKGIEFERARMSNLIDNLLIKETLELNTTGLKLQLEDQIINQDYESITIGDLVTDNVILILVLNSEVCNDCNEFAIETLLEVLSDHPGLNYFVIYKNDNIRYTKEKFAKLGLRNLFGIISPDNNVDVNSKYPFFSILFPDGNCEEIFFPGKDIPKEITERYFVNIVKKYRLITEFIELE